MPYNRLVLDFLCRPPACALESGDRLALGVTAPACGLELTRVYYPEAAFRDPAAIRWHQE